MSAFYALSPPPYRRCLHIFKHGEAQTRGRNEFRNERGEIVVIGKTLVGEKTFPFRFRNLLPRAPTCMETTGREKQVREKTDSAGGCGWG